MNYVFNNFKAAASNCKSMSNSPRPLCNSLLAFYKPCNREAKSDLKKKRKRKEEEAQIATR